MAEIVEPEKAAAETRPREGPASSGDEKKLAEDGESGTSSRSTTAPLVNVSSLERFNTITRRDAREQLDGPPALPFNLRHHKLALSIFTFLALAECCFIPLSLYYGLSKGTDMRSGKSCSRHEVF